MPSPYCERAIDNAQTYKKALLKIISPNDVGLTGSHQRGYYIPIDSWHLFTSQKPEKGVNYHHAVKIVWQDGSATTSNVIWYGQKKYEYRITTFGRDFPFLTLDNVGDLLVLIPKSLTEFYGYVLDIDDDIEEIQAALGVEILKSYAIYEEGKSVEETEDVCLNRKFREFASTMVRLPQGVVFSGITRDSVLECVHGFSGLTPDEQLIRLIAEEYNLYRMVERKVFTPEVQQLFKDIDAFLETAMHILQARRSRAGRSLENHVEFLLNEAGIPHQMRPVVDKTEPDIIIPGKIAYEDPAYPASKLFVIALKMTCKDRWRQVTQEAPRIKHKHIVTMQKGISVRQLDEMRLLNVSLIVPEKLHKEYPRDRRELLLTLGNFLDTLKTKYHSS